MDNITDGELSNPCTLIHQSFGTPNFDYSLLLGRRLLPLELISLATSLIRKISKKKGPKSLNLCGAPYHHISSPPISS